MSWMQCSFYSNVLNIECPVNVIMPTGIKGRENKINNVPVLYLLHGLTEDHTVWMRRTSIERYVLRRNIAVVMPTVHQSLYTDMSYGSDYFRYISEELPSFIKSTFHISDKREDTFAAGLSMGGYGAFKLGLSQPEKFMGVASLSGAVDIHRVLAEGKNLKETKAVFGVQIQPENDLYKLAEKCEIEGQFPNMYQCCGTEDFLYVDNIEFCEFIRKKNKLHTYEESSGGHTWKFWDSSIQKVLSWIEELNPKVCWKEE